MADNKFQKPRGTQDILPAQQPAWRFVRENFTKICLDAGFEQIITPAFEDTNLYIRSVGVDTEVVNKEMYSFEDRSGNKLSLKPESTAGIVRAYIENGMASWSKPVKLFYIEPHFRYERPQAGRFRQHYQLGVEVFGLDEALVDVHVIALASRFFKNLGLVAKLQINTIGDRKTRSSYQRELVAYFMPYIEKLPDIAKLQLEKNPLRILDSKDPAVAKLNAEAPQILDYLDEQSKDHFSSVLECLDNLGIEYDVNPQLVRGFDYYDKTVFEFKGSRVGMQDALGGGGRYDGLVEELGGRLTPAIGFGLGLERIVAELDESKRVFEASRPLVYIVGLGEESRCHVQNLAEKFLDSGIATVNSFGRGSITDQLAQADKLGVRYALILGKKELLTDRVIVKDMHSTNQESVLIAQAVEVIVKRLV